VGLSVLNEGKVRVDHPSPAGSVTIWLEQLRSGDPAAAKALWDGYFARLVALARGRLRAIPRGLGDEEDVALAAFDSFCRAAQAGRFPRLDDRDDLWQVLLVLTDRKAANLIRHETRERRGGGAARVPTAGAADSISDALASAVAAGPTPDVVAETSEACARLLGLLTGADLRAVAVWKLEGYTNEEIAGKLGRSIPTVERKLATIRAIWEREGTQ
jgi:DNA-directed RNA polymerase specialized sigma24 family protein